MTTAESGQDGRGNRVGRALASRVVVGECIEVLADLAEGSVDAVVCDPPYAIRFKGEHWDSRAIRAVADERCNRRLSDGEAFEVWCEMWGAACDRVMRPGAHLVAFGSPRTYHRLVGGLENAGLEIRDSLMWLYGTGVSKSHRLPGGRATTLKPAFEPIVLARKRISEPTLKTLQRHGTGALEVSACRVNGRHPANVLASHDRECSEEVCAATCPLSLLDREASRKRPSAIKPSRFIYCPKPSRREREAGCDGLPLSGLDLFPKGVTKDTRNPHPTVKPVEVMSWLVRLISPPAGLVLDPFAGSGTTGIAAKLEGRRFCGIEKEPRYAEIARARIAHSDRPAAS